MGLCVRAVFGWTWAWLVAFLVAPVCVRAHGEGAAISAVVGLDASAEPWLLALSEGHYVRTQDGAFFLCPAALGLDTPPLAAADGQGALLVGERGVHRLSPAGELSPEPISGWPELEVLSLATFRDQVFALSLGRTPGVALLQLSDAGAEVVFESAFSFTAMAAGDEGLWLGAFAGGRLHLTLVTARGDPTPLSELAFPAPLEELTATAPVVRLRAVGDRLFVIVISGSDRHLLEVDRSEARLGLLRSTSQPLLGPVAGDAGAFVLDGNRLLRLAEAGIEDAGSDLIATGLSMVDGHSFAASVAELYALPLAEPARALLSLDGILPPPPALFDGDPLCQAQWLRFVGDLERVGLAAGERADGHDDVRDAGPERARDAAASEADGGARPVGTDAGDGATASVSDGCGCAVLGRSNRAQAEAGGWLFACAAGRLLRRRTPPGRRSRKHRLAKRLSARAGGGQR